MLVFSTAMFVGPVPAVSQSAIPEKIGSHASRPYMVVVPACPISPTGRFTTGQFAKDLEIDYLPSRKGAVIANPQSLTLRLVVNACRVRDNDRTVTFSRKDEVSWKTTIPLASQWVYAIWYLRDGVTDQQASE